MTLRGCSSFPYISTGRSEEHTSELQSRVDLVCRLLLEKKKQLDFMFHVKQFDYAERPSPPYQVELVDTPHLVKKMVGRGKMKQKEQKTAFREAVLPNRE